MGDCYFYRVKALNGDIKDRLIQDGFADITNERSRSSDILIDIYLNKIDEAIKNHEISINDNTVLNGHFLGGYYFGEDNPDKMENPLQSIRLSVSADNKIGYLNKWSQNFGIPFALSTLYPDLIIEAVEIPPYGRATRNYLKDGKWTNKEGEIAPLALCGINPVFFKEKTEDSIKVSLPIGDENDKWGIITLPLKNVSGYYEEQNEYDTIMFTEEEISVKFKNKTEIMPVKDLCKKFYDNKKAFREYSNAIMALYGVSERDITRRENNNNVYYIVEIPVPENISENGILSTTVSEYTISDTDTENEKNIKLGARNKFKNCHVVKNGNIDTIRLTNEKIKELYDGNVQEIARLTASENTEEEEEEKEL